MPVGRSHERYQPRWLLYSDHDFKISTIDFHRFSKSMKIDDRKYYCINLIFSSKQQETASPAFRQCPKTQGCHGCLSDRFLCTVFIFAAAILQKYDFYENRWKSTIIAENRWKSLNLGMEMIQTGNCWEINDVPWVTTWRPIVKGGCWVTMVMMVNDFNDISCRIFF